MARKRHATENESRFRDYIRRQQCLVQRGWNQAGRCQGRMEFCHLVHDGMGGSRSNPIIGNGVPLCTAHHTGSQGMDTIGRQTFAQRHGLDLEAIAAKLAHEWEDGFLD